MLDKIKQTSSRTARMLRSLRNDSSGNTLVIVAAALIPMMAMVGSAVDISRGYMAQTRLQQACDAGVLAGRRAMANGAYGNAEKLVAQKFFEANFYEDYLGTGDTTFETSNPTGTFRVVGKATISVPTVIMQAFDINETEIDVECASTVDIANSDITMVLDTTGSMAFDISNGTGGTTTRLAALRTAANSFYRILKEAANGTNSRIRYAMVPYTGAVNIGEAIYDVNKNYLIGGSNSSDAYAYQSRAKVQGTWVRQQVTYPVYNYVQTVKSGTVRVPASDTVAYTRWAGCVQEPDTHALNNINYNSASKKILPAEIRDLDIDLVPDSNATRWRPYWPETTYFDWYGTLYKSQTSCPQKARLLRPYTANEFSTYLNSLIADGGTYHDIGMLWGARVSSPEGIFADNVNEAPTNDGFVSRHLIFMTDGDLDIGGAYHSAYGLEWYDRLIGYGDEAVASANHIKRFQALCAAVRGKGIRVWVIAFATTLTPEMTECASDDSAFTSTNASSLNETFIQIAQSVADLRIAQ